MRDFSFVLVIFESQKTHRGGETKKISAICPFPSQRIYWISAEKAYQKVSLFGIVF
jgi:hypothetical protein